VAARRAFKPRCPEGDAADAGPRSRRAPGIVRRGSRCTQARARPGRKIAAGRLASAGSSKEARNLSRCGFASRTRAAGGGMEENPITQMAIPGLPRSVLFVVPRFHTNLAVAARALVEAGSAVHVFAASESPIEDHSVVVPRIFADGAGSGDVAAAIRDAAPDIVFIRSCKPLSKIAGWHCRRHAIRAYAYGQSPLTATPSLGRRMTRWLDGQPLRRVTPVPGLDRAAAKDRLASFLPLPVAAERSAAGPPDPRAGALRFLCVGKLAQPRKNQDRLIAALEALDRPGEIELTLAGSSSAPSGASRAHCEALLARAAAREGRFPVRILADVPYREMPALYAGHHVCVLPSDAEPLGTAPVEAMAHGLVPIFSDRCGSAGYVTDGRDGFVVDPHDAVAFTGLLRRLLDDRDLVARVGAAARATARGALGTAAFLSRVADLAAGKPGAR
jgi:glycosyltransferase involved in cell wall biosynthesis